jgi:hypothetical protein
MSRVCVRGYGVVSPAGWGRDVFAQWIAGERTVALSEVERPDGRRHPVLRVPAPAVRASWQMHPRLRRASPISHFTVAAALEAVAMVEGAVDVGRLGIVSCVLGGSVQYSRRFFGEVGEDPTTASPMLFPETVFNAPASHLAAVLGAPLRNDTCVSDETGFLSGMVMAADWLARGLVDHCLVVGAEEADWTTSEAVRLFSRTGVASEGAAAVLLGMGGDGVGLEWVGSPRPYVRGRPRVSAVAATLAEVRERVGERVYGVGLGTPGVKDLTRRVGNGLGALGGWACVAAIGAVLGEGGRAGVCVAGSNLQVMGGEVSSWKIQD